MRLMMITACLGLLGTGSAYGHSGTHDMNWQQALWHILTQGDHLGLLLVVILLVITLVAAFNMRHHGL